MKEESKKWAEVATKVKEKATELQNLIKELKTKRGEKIKEKDRNSYDILLFNKTL